MPTAFLEVSRLNCATTDAEARAKREESAAIFMGVRVVFQVFEKAVHGPLRAFIPAPRKGTRGGLISDPLQTVIDFAGEHDSRKTPM